MKTNSLIKLSTRYLKSKFDKNSIVNNQCKIWENEMQRLKYEKFNNSNDVITIDLHNGYSVIAVTGFNAENRVYNTTLFLKDNTIDTWKLIENAENLEFHANQNTINSAILKQISTFLEEGFFDYYIQRYEYESNCFDIGNKIFEKERLSGVDVS